MGQIPDHDDAFGLRRCGQLCHVMHPPGAVIHLCQHEHSDGFVEGCGHVFGRNGTDGLALHQAGQAVSHIKIRREVAGIRQDHRAVRA